MENEKRIRKIEPERTEYRTTEELSDKEFKQLEKLDRDLRRSFIRSAQNNAEAFGLRPVAGLMVSVATLIRQIYEGAKSQNELATEAVIESLHDMGIDINLDLFLEDGWEEEDGE